jgi:tRNA 2-thiocytidine biosynthesis protein TtcA
MEIAMAYASRLEARIAKKATRAIVNFGLVDDGDRIMVALSGGKDSWTLMQILEVLRQRAPIRFSLVAVHVNYGDNDGGDEVIARTCAARGWECRVERTTIRDVMADLLEPEATPCSLCARFRRGVLYRLAHEVGATKIALGHHADDVIETLLLNLFFAGTLKAMPARLVSGDEGHVVIRPLVHVAEEDCRAYASASALPIVSCPCPACGDMTLQRQRVKRLLSELERDHPGVKNSMVRALGNVSARHLLDTRLHPVAALCTARTAGFDGEDGADGARALLRALAHQT